MGHQKHRHVALRSPAEEPNPTTTESADGGADMGQRNSIHMKRTRGLGSGTCNSRFVVWPLELGSGTRNPHFFA